MSGPIVRRLRLPAAPTSPGLARTEVASLLADAGLPGLHDEAILLTSELVTNSVIHARSEVDLEIVADADGVKVSVTDFGQVLPEQAVDELIVTFRDGRAGRRASNPGSPDQLPTEGGRGLLLVSRFATRWGTSQDRTGRSVWFRLDRSAAGIGNNTGNSNRVSNGAAPPAGSPGRRAAGTVGNVPDLDSALAAIIGAPRSGNGSARAAVQTGLDALRDLVARLADGLRAATATVTVDRGDGVGPRTLAHVSSPEPMASEGRVVRVPLPLSRPWTGEFTATGAVGRYAQPLATLTAGQLALIIENQRLDEAAHDGRGWLLFLAEAGELLAHSMSVDLTVALIPQLVVPRLGRWCAVHLRNEYGELIRGAINHADEAAVQRLATDLDARITLLDKLHAGEAATPLAPPTEGMAFPLVARGECIGTLAVGRPAGRPHQVEELAIIEDLARRAAVAIENARVHESRSQIADTLQRPLLPPALPTIDRLEVAAQYVPRGEGADVGGDFYDLVTLPEQAAEPAAGQVEPARPGWMLVVGDVSGKGVGAAAVTGLVRDVLHTRAADHHAPEHTLSRLNTALVDRGGGYFCTLALAFLTSLGAGVFD
ncbi:MAG TPA: SpoIIE family protein phosphatase, partial [Micromonosporaceae bacterium]